MVAPGTLGVKPSSATFELYDLDELFNPLCLWFLSHKVGQLYTHLIRLLG